jgi:hypothetical protein
MSIVSNVLGCDFVGTLPTHWPRAHSLMVVEKVHPDDDLFDPA